MGDFIQFLADESPLILAISILIILFLIVIILTFIAKNSSNNDKSRYGNLKKTKLHKEYEYSYRLRREIPVTHKKDDKRMRYLDDDQLEMFRLYCKLTEKEKNFVQTQMREFLNSRIK